MSTASYKERYIDLISRFLEKEISPETFCAEFTDLWIQERDQVLARKQSWPEPYDQILLESWQRGEHTDEQFGQQWAELWGYAEDIDFRNMADSIHSACDSFDPAPETEWEISEEQLRQEISEVFSNYKAGRGSEY